MLRSNKNRTMAGNWWDIDWNPADSPYWDPIVAPVIDYTFVALGGEAPSGYIAQDGSFIEGISNAVSPTTVSPTGVISTKPAAGVGSSSNSWMPLALLGCGLFIVFKK